MHENMEASQGSMDIVCHAMLQKSLVRAFNSYVPWGFFTLGTTCKKLAFTSFVGNKADAKRFLIDVLYQNPGTPHLEGPSNDVKYFGLCTEGGDYFMKIKELQAYLDMYDNVVKGEEIVRPGCSEQVLKVALSSMSSLVNVLTTMSSTSKIHASL
ncbi:hypothetical protein EZV62_015649 [Acer yangbiense]|uniref:Uncharacterized protein n=1 Tax=Acer yangbiense TaxID=1000413 RepID=A0A5C7HLC4_9ROSI|nr:hypothetical protein EZV62_015649 [Acer yangbiense]